MSVIFKNFSFKMGYTALSTLLRELGKKGNRVKAFEQSLIDESSKSIAIDGHVIRLELPELRELVSSWRLP